MSQQLQADVREELQFRHNLSFSRRVAVQEELQSEKSCTRSEEQRWMTLWETHVKQLRAYSVGFDYNSAAAATTALLVLLLLCCLFFLRRMCKKKATPSSCPE